MNSIFLISDAAKQVNVEAHVLRYWEEELGLPIKRNELGHRFYTQIDVDRFREIKSMKERGLQLKAIRMLLKDGKLDRLDNIQGSEVVSTEIQEPVIYDDSGEEKAKRLQFLLQQLFRETLQENNKELCQIIKESVLKEMDYQFRVQEEREEEHHAELMKNQEEHFKKVDELLRKKRGLLKK